MMRRFIGSGRRRFEGVGSWRRHGICPRCGYCPSESVAAWAYVQYVMRGIDPADELRPPPNAIETKGAAAGEEAGEKSR